MTIEPTTPIQEETTGAPALVPEPVTEVPAPEPAPEPAIPQPGLKADAAPPVPEPEPPVVELTFAGALQSAIQKFSTDVGSLATLDTGVDQSDEAVASAQSTLATAQGTQTTKVADREDGRVAARASRDQLITVLQSWSP